MKWRLFILMLVATACAGKVTITEAEIKSDIFYTERCTKPFTGRCIVVFSDTSLVREEFTYKSGILNGKATAWYKNGQIRRRGSYTMGMISGKWEFWMNKVIKPLRPIIKMICWTACMYPYIPAQDPGERSV